jgi:hypothetical protein
MEFFNLGKGTAAGIVVALVAGVVLGYFVIPYFFPLQAAGSTSGVHRTYFDQEWGSETIDLLSFIHPDLSINFTVEQGEIVFSSLSCVITLEGDAESTFGEQVMVLFSVDGVSSSGPSTHVWVEDSDLANGDTIQFSVSLFNNHTLTPGDHYINVKFLPLVNLNHQVQKCNLMVQTIIP